MNLPIAFVIDLTSHPLTYLRHSPGILSAVTVFTPKAGPRLTVAPVTGPGPGTPESALRVLQRGAGLCLHLKYVLFEFKRALCNLLAE